MVWTVHILLSYFIQLYHLLCTLTPYPYRAPTHLTQKSKIKLYSCVFYLAFFECICLQWSKFCFSCCMNEVTLHCSSIWLSGKVRPVLAGMIRDGGFHWLAVYLRWNDGPFIGLSGHSIREKNLYFLFLLFKFICHLLLLWVSTVCRWLNPKNKAGGERTGCMADILTTHVDSNVGSVPFSEPACTIAQPHISGMQLSQIHL